MTSPGPIAFTFFGMEFRWYGLLVALGMVTAVMLSYYRAPRFKISSDDAYNSALFIVPMGVIGARLYYVLFSWDYYSKNPGEIVNLRAGGLAIHGGLIFGILAAYIFCRLRKINLLNFLDLYLPHVALAQAIGRWGNFFNNEAHGTETDLPWAVIIDGKGYHPTFLYESIWCIIIFISLSIIAKNRKFIGQIACLYGMLYSFERFFVEGLRTDSLMLGSLRQAQIISVCIFAFSIALYIYLKKNPRSKIYPNELPPDLERENANEPEETQPIVKDLEETQEDAK